MINIKMGTLETERLTIRAFTMEDLPAIHQALDTVGGRVTGSLHERRTWLEWTVRNYPALEALYQPPYGDRAIVLKRTGEVIGACGFAQALGPFGLLPYFRDLVKPDLILCSLPDVGLYWALGEPYRGKGYATEAARRLIEFAFNDLELAHIVATTEYTNLASQRVMQRLGMRIEKNPSPEPVWFQVVGILENPNP